MALKPLQSMSINQSPTFGYNASSLVDALRAADKNLSRTVMSACVNTDVSPDKVPLLISGSMLERTIERNRVLMANYILGAPPDSASNAGDLHASVLTIASLALQGMLPSSLFRKWQLNDRKFGPEEDSREVPPGRIQHELGELAQRVIDSSLDPIRRAALLEWSIGTGPLHPFYDACGRIGRAAAALVLVQGGILLPNYPAREVYFSVSTKGWMCFEEGFRQWVIHR